MGFIDAICFVLLGSVVPGLLGIAFLLQHRVGGFINIGLGGLVVLGAFVLSKSVGVFGLNVATATVLCIMACSLVALAIEVTVFRSLARARADGARLLLVSLAVYLVIANLVDLAAGGVTASIMLDDSTGTISRFGPLMPWQWLEVAVALMVVAVASVFVRRTATGCMFRALADNVSLAELSGIDSMRVSAVSSVVGGALCGLGGAMLAIDTGVAPSAGLNLVIAGAVAAILGGLRDISGVFLGALAVSGLQQATVWLVGPQWMTLATYAVLLAALSWRRGAVFSRNRADSSIWAK